MQKMLHIEIYLRNLLESGCVMFEVSTKSGYPNFKGHKSLLFTWYARYFNINGG